MAKTIAINPSWYWPEEVPRLIGVPPMSCERLMVERWSRRRPDAVAVADEHGALTYAELWSRARGVAAVLRRRGAAGQRVALVGAQGVDGLLALIGALAAAARPILLDPRSQAAAEAAAVGASLAVVQQSAPAPAGVQRLDLTELLEEACREDLAPASTGAGDAARDVHEPVLDLVSADGWLAGHCDYSLVSGALSLAAFLQIEQPCSWLCAMGLWSWEGLYSALVPLYSGATAVMCGAEGASDGVAHLVDEHQVAYTIAPFEILHELARGRPRRLAGSFSRNLRGLILSTAHPFPAAERRKARKALDVPVLTMFGMAETGPILASHPSWYVDESVGIPVTNVEVQPANPQTGEALDTNWELLDYATMVIRAPQLMAGYEGAAAQEQRLARRLADGWFQTWALASFDANGMMYLVES